MKIVCDNCSAKYQISDDKVRNKTFKIRCKKCSHVIVVRGGQQEAEDAAADAAAADAAAADPGAPAAAGDPDAIWHVVINRENVGPLAPGQVEAYFHNGDIDAETFVWAEGMADWSRLGSIPQFAHLAPPAAAAPAAVAAAPMAAAAAPVAEDPTAQAPAGMFPSEDDDVIASTNVADAVSAPAAASGAGMFPAEEPANPRISTAAQLRNQRNENSVLFSLDSLAAEVESSKKAKVSNTGGSEASGLIDISALSGLDSPGGGDDPFGGGMGMAPAPLTGAAPVQPLVAPSSKSNTGLIIGLVAVIVLLLGGGGIAAWMLLKDDPKPETVAQNEPPGKMTVGADPAALAAEKAAAEKAAAEKAAAEKAEAEAKAAAEKGEGDDGDEGEDGADGDEGEEKVAANTAKRTRRARPSRPARKPATRDKPAAAAEKPAPSPARRAPARKKEESTSEVDDLLGALNDPGGGAKSRGSAGGSAVPAAAAPAGDPLLPEKLDRRQILTVVKKNARSIQSCKDGTDASGTVAVEMVIGRSGRVTSADVKGGPHKGTPVGSCVERKVRAFRFPQFSGEPMRVQIPFQL